MHVLLFSFLDVHYFIFLWEEHIAQDDFNANTRCTSQFGDELSQLCRCNSLCLADTLFLPQDTFTFISSSHDTVSWLDHILTTTSGYSILTDACVKTDFITSDHLPLCFTISIDNLHIPVSLSD